MRKMLMLAAALMIGGLTWSVPGIADVMSLRGDKALDAKATAPDRRRQVTDDEGFKRDWKEQPPLIPHKIDKDQVTLDVNTCMRCHGPDTYKEENAPKVADSHFIAADGTKMETLNMRRYFCSQCHVPQLDAKPLVDNTFKSN